MSKKIFIRAITHRIIIKISGSKSAEMATFLAKINIFEYTIEKSAEFGPKNTKETCF